MLYIIVGMPGSGKSIARIYAERNSIPYFSTGDIVRQEVKSRGLPPDAETTARVSDEMRGEDGLGVTRLALEKALDAGHDTVFLEGMRSWQEIELIRSRASAMVVAFVAPRRTRQERIRKRGRVDDSPGLFVKRDMREIDYGTATPIALADAYVLNTGTIEEALQHLEDIVRGASDGLQTSPTF